MRLNRFALAVFALASLQACSVASVESKDADESTYYGYYSGEYDAETSQFKAYVDFTVGGMSGTHVKFNSPSKVTVNGQDLTERKTLGSHYNLTVPTQTPPQELVFVWTRMDGSTVTNRIELAPISVSAPARNDSLSKAAGITVSFQGAPATPNNSVTCDLTLDSVQPEDVFMTASAYSTSGNTCVFSKASLDKLGKGSATVQLRRSQNARPAQGHEKHGGLLSSTYTSAKVQVQVVD